MQEAKQIRFVYVAGPMSKGDQFLNARTGILAGEALRSHGFHPFVPMLSTLWHMLAPVDYEAWMAYDFAWIERCDALLRLPGESTGADREVEHARKLGIPVFHSLVELQNYCWYGTLAEGA